MKRRSLIGAALAAPLLPRRALAVDAVKVAVFNVSSALPFYVARERGFFAEAGIAAEAVPLQAAPLIVQAMVAGEVDAASNLVTLEGANINARRANTAFYIQLGGQNDTYRMEQFVARPGFAATGVKELRARGSSPPPGPPTWPRRAPCSLPMGCRRGATTR